MEKKAIMLKATNNTSGFIKGKTRKEYNKEHYRLHCKEIKAKHKKRLQKPKSRKQWNLYQKKYRLQPEVKAKQQTYYQDNAEDIKAKKKKRDKKNREQARKDNIIEITRLDAELKKGEK